MKKIAAKCLAGMVLIISCSKSHDTTGIIVTPNIPDTSTLVKTDITYSLDGAGNVGDSMIIATVFDNQRRLAFYLSYDDKFTDVDSTTFSYSSTQNVEKSVLYFQHVLTASSVTTNYLNSAGLIDSSIRLDVLANKKSVGYYYYDNNRHDTLDVGYSIDSATGAKSLGTTFHYYYSNNNLDSNTQISNKGVETSVQRWSMGNLLSDTETLGVDEYLNHTYGYNNVPSGGFFAVFGTTNLLTSFQEVFSDSPNSGRDETFTYSFDSVNRVSVQFSFKAGVAYSKSVLTYY